MKKLRKYIFNGAILASEKEPTGIARVSLELLKELDKIIEPGEVIVFAPWCSIDSSTFHNIRLKKIGSYGTGHKPKVQKLLRSFWRNVVFRLFVFISGKEVVTVNTALAWNKFFFDVISIYDCTHDLFPELILPQNKSWYAKLTDSQRNSCKNARYILTDSFSAQRDINKIYGIDTSRIKVIYCGWQHFNSIDEDDSIIKAHSLVKNEFFFSLGSQLPHKNIKWIVCAARKHPEYKFVVTGTVHVQKDNGFDGEALPNLVYTGYLKDGEIKALMHNCKAFIQPSLYEGFGIPPMEAMSVGADCIVSNTGSLPEVYKKSVWYIDPYDYDNIDLDEIMSRPKEDNDIILNEYSWEKSAKILLEYLRELS